jgi:rhamnosyltransferase
MTALQVTVVILTRNGMGKYLPQTLAAVLGQKPSFPYDVLAIDSASSDATVDFLRSHEGVRLHSIPLHSFGHGQTRQSALSLTDVPVLVYLTQDALPSDNQWLQELVSRLQSAKDVGAACSRILPREEALPLRKYSVLSEWSSSENDFEVRREQPPPFETKEPFFRCLHNISAAYRRDVLEEVGFRDVPFGEDLLMARDLLEMGYAVTFAARSVVRHSHSYRLWGTFQRNVVDGRFHRRQLGYRTVDSRRAVARSVWVQVARDWYALRRDANLGAAAKLYNALYSPWIHLAEGLGQYAGNAELL